MRFDVFSPYRSSRYCGAPKPGKEKHKSDDYRSAILIVHGFRSFLSVFTSVLRKIWREVTRKSWQELRTTDCADATDGITEKRTTQRNGRDLAAGVHRGGRPTIERSNRRSIRRGN